MNQDEPVTIPAWQRDVHVLAEAFAVCSLPLLFGAARAAKPPHKGFLTFMAYGTLLVDGYLLYRFLSAPRR